MSIDKIAKMGDIQLVVVGNNNVGKSSLCVTFSTGQFPSLFTPMECNRVPHEKDVTVGETTVHVKCVDTEGHEDYDSTRPESYPDTNVFLLCFSLSSETSFESLKSKWLPELKHHAPRVPILLVGCKSDLRRGNDAKNLITVKQAKSMCKQLKAAGYVECSALKKLGVDECFLQATKIALGKADSGKGCGCVLL